LEAKGIPGWSDSISNESDFALCAVRCALCAVRKVGRFYYFAHAPNTPA